MKMTRDHHSKFMLVMMPILTICYFVQSYFYIKYGPEVLAQDVVAFLGLGLLGVFLYYYLYDRFHEVYFHPSHLEVRVAPLSIQHEYLYREIVDVEILQARRSFGHVIIHLKDGQMCKLAHVDNPQEIRKYILERA